MGKHHERLKDGYVWFYGTARYHTHPVGKTQPNAFGLFDMSGNIWEWTNDWYAFSYYSQSPRMNPKGPSKGAVKLRRGGAWANFSPYVRSATRYRRKLGHRRHTLGFRIVRSTDKNE